MNSKHQTVTLDDNFSLMVSITVDDCWSIKSGRVDGHIAVNKDKFPDGIDGLAKKIHAMNLKIGIYSSKSVRLALLKDSILMVSSGGNSYLRRVPCQLGARGDRCCRLGIMGHRLLEI